MDRVELLAPAGNLEKLKMAIIYGADAVYLGGKDYGLRAYADNFTLEQMEEGIKFAHDRGKKVYLTLNIIPHNEDLEHLEGYIKRICHMGIDGTIVADPGMFYMVKNICPQMDIHLSTQANNTNWASALFWHKQGVKRIILARELSLKEIARIREKTPPDLQLEVFVHGAMCISYSGRCLLSNYMADRDSNRGQCAQPCRWKYHLVEEKRPGEYMPVFEDERGTYIFNSKDLCMIGHIHRLIEGGVGSLKIEGRMKSSYYVATVTGAYRKAIDDYYSDPESYSPDPLLLDEVSKVSHREYSTGFYLGEDGPGSQVYKSSSYIREYDFVGIVVDYDPETGYGRIEQRNPITLGDEIEIMVPRGGFFTQKITGMLDGEKNPITRAPHPRMTLYIPLDRPVAEFSILRRKPR